MAMKAEKSERSLRVVARGVIGATVVVRLACVMPTVMSGILATCVFLGATSAIAQESPNLSSSVEFARRSLDTLMTVSGPSANRWREVAASYPNEIIAAIVGAQKRGWKPTARTLYQSRGQRPLGPGLRPIALLQNLGLSTSDGEMLVWDWDDGNPTTAEGTVWVHSYYTGNETLFNVQFAGDTYDNMWVSYQQDVSALYADPLPSSGVIKFRGPAPTVKPRIVLVAQQRADCSNCYAQADRIHENYCNRMYMDAGGACLGESAASVLRDGVRGAAAGQAYGLISGAFAGGLAGAIAGGIGNTVPGFAAG
ncbi:MAG TPA: hypothetical protein VEL79_20720, partial [Vicinamibacterales bacterium]|nr:hypothetical protein [Vicinamibacterales bacterium]